MIQTFEVRATAASEFEVRAYDSTCSARRASTN